MTTSNFDKALDAILANIPELLVGTFEGKPIYKPRAGQIKKAIKDAIAEHVLDELLEELDTKIGIRRINTPQLLNTFKREVLWTVEDVQRVIKAKRNALYGEGE